jgi:hypothetical protein
VLLLGEQVLLPATAGVILPALVNRLTTGDGRSILVEQVLLPTAEQYYYKYYYWVLVPVLV